MMIQNGLIALLVLIFSFDCLGQNSVAGKADKLNILVIFAHPDEGEIYAGGISAIYSNLGHRVKFLSLTNGDAGHWSMNPADLAKRRYKEAMEAKRILGLADYEVLDYHDGKLKNTSEIQKIVALKIEEWESDIVILFYPITTVPGGHNDNMQAGHIAKEAAALVNMKKTPAYLYMRDYFTTDFSHIPDIAVNIGAVWGTKLLAMKAHESQVVESNPHADGVLDEVLKSEIKRQEYLFYNSYPYSRVTPDIKLALEKWYGREEADTVKWAEAYQFAEFGRQIDDRAVSELFPMLASPCIVHGKDEWLDTGMDLKTGDVIDIRSNGEVVWKKSGFNWCSPDGNTTYTHWGNRAVLGSPVGALIGKIGGPKGYTFFVGSKSRIEACADGRLFLGINDDNVEDNSGYFNVWIRIIKQLKP
jgi:LmbE family N-acetylglucosaminyl deacetylase